MPDNTQSTDHATLPQPTQVSQSYPPFVMPQQRPLPPGAQGVLPQPTTFVQSPRQPADAPTIAQLERLVKEQTNEPATPQHASSQPPQASQQEASSGDAAPKESNDTQPEYNLSGDQKASEENTDAQQPKGKDAPPPLAELADSDSDDVPQEVHDINRQLEEARNKQSTAKEQAAMAIEEVKEAEQKAMKAQEQLQDQLKEAQQKVEHANRTIATAEKKHQESERQFQQVQQASGGANSVTVAGYKPTDLLEALVKPPQAADPSQPTGPTLDKNARQQVSQAVGQTAQEVQHTKQHVEQAGTYIQAA